MCIFGISLLGSEHVLVARNAILKTALKVVELKRVSG